MNSNKRLTPIFIGGTGRSGTTILSKYVGSNKTVVKIPFESRFMIDRDGLMDLYNALSDNYSFDQGRVAIRSFYEKMTNEMLNPYRSPYLGWNKQKYISEKDIKTSTKTLIDKISNGTFRAADYNSPDASNYLHNWRKAYNTNNNLPARAAKKVLGNRVNFLKLSLHHLKKEDMFIPKYFSDKELLINYLGDYVIDIFKSIFETNSNAKAWCEDTPANLLNISFLNKLFPDAKFIHVMRHPVGVAHSMRRMVWAPDRLDQCCDILENLYAKLIEVHKNYVSDANYHFVKLEDLIYDENKELLNIFLGLDRNDYSHEIKIEEDKMNYFLKEMDPSDYELAASRLENAINFFGYK
jgi:hypothetical protein